MYGEKVYSSLSNSDFKKLSQIIHSQSGIKVPDSKKIMVEARLRKRLKELHLSNYDEYCDYLFSEEGKKNEVLHMVDVITTNKTDFFREPKQFEFLYDKALPELISQGADGLNHNLKIWSAGCSSGEEPYTISIVLKEFVDKQPRLTYDILATDISIKVLEKAVKGIYDEERISPVPTELLKKYFLRSKDKNKGLVRLIPEIRRSISFKWLNFMEDDFGIKDKFDVIFCRNVIIYFDKQTQDGLIEKLLGYLKPGGFLFLGHSESIFNSSLPIVQLAASTYRKIR